MAEQPSGADDDTTPTDESSSAPSGDRLQGTADEQSAAAAGGPPDRLGVAAVTIGTDNSVDTDDVGAAAVEAIEAADATVPSREIVTPDYDSVQRAIDGLVVREDVDAIVTLGGTGIAPGEEAVNAARALFDKDLPGFGEVYRARVREESAASGIGQRATAGVVDGVVVVCLPRTTEAVRLGLAQLALPELPGLADELRVIDISE